MEKIKLYEKPYLAEKLCIMIIAIIADMMAQKALLKYIQAVHLQSGNDETTQVHLSHSSVEIRLSYFSQRWNKN